MLDVLSGYASARLPSRASLASLDVLGTRAAPRFGRGEKYRLVSALLLAAACGCAYVGAPLPPTLHIPERVTVLSASQHAGQLVVGFLVSGKTTDGVVLKSLREIDVRYGPPDASIDHWAAGAKRIPVEPHEDKGYQVRTPVAGLEDHDIAVAVRVVGPSGRPGAWSEPVTVHVVPAPPTPVVEAAAGPDGITLRWPAAGAPPDTLWRILRQTQGDAEPKPVAHANAPEWLDATATVEDQQYSYKVQALVPAGKRSAESEFSNVATVTYKDVFPPVPPSHITAIAGVNSIELAWDPCREPDLKAYQVWRAEGSGPLVKLADVGGEVTYSDHQVVSGKLYRYAISASDNKGNVSQPGAAIEIAAP